MTDSTCQATALSDAPAAVGADGPDLRLVRGPGVQGRRALQGQRGGGGQCGAIAAGIGLGLQPPAGQSAMLEHRWGKIAQNTLGNNVPSGKEKNRRNAKSGLSLMPTWGGGGKSGFDGWNLFSNRK